MQMKGSRGRPHILLGDGREAGAMIHWRRKYKVGQEDHEYEKKMGEGADPPLQLLLCLN